METLRSKLRLLGAVASVTYKEWAAYRTHSMVSILVGPLHYMIQIVIWTAVFSTRGEIGGMELGDMLRYYGISTLIVYLTMDFADWNLQMLIHTGKYATFALRPVHHRFFAFSQKVGHRILGFVFEFIPVLLIFTLVFKVNLMPASAGWFAVSVALSFLTVFYINYCIGLTGFWLVRTSGLRSVVKLLTAVFSGSLLPLSFFPEALQKIMLFMPFQFMAYVPASVFNGEYRLGGVSCPLPAAVGLQACCAAALMLLSEVLYRLGNRRFTGIGV